MCWCDLERGNFVTFAAVYNPDFCKVAVRAVRFSFELLRVNIANKNTIQYMDDKAIIYYRSEGLPHTSLADSGAIFYFSRQHLP